MQEKTIAIDPDKCHKDGLCASVCPARIFEYEKKEVPNVSGQELCVLCGHCMAVCPHGAVTHSVLKGESFGKIKDQAKVDAGAVEALLMQRRSVRVYKKDPVPRSELEEIISLAGFAPTSAHGGEGWVRSCVVVSGEESMRRVRDMTAEYLKRLAGLLDSFMVRMIARWKPETRVGLSMLPDIAMRLKRYEQGEDVITYDAPHAVFFHSPRHSPYPDVSCHAALYTVMLAAHARGLGTCWNGWLTKAANGFRVKGFTKMKEFLGFPDHHEVFCAATLGTRGVKLHSTPHRETTIRFIGP